MVNIHKEQRRTRVFTYYVVLTITSMTRNLNVWKELLNTALQCQLHNIRCVLITYVHESQQTEARGKERFSVVMDIY